MSSDEKKVGPVSGLTRVSWDELLTSSDVASNLEGLAQRGVIESVFPELHAMVGFGGGDSGHKDLWGHTKQVVQQTLPRPMLRWAALFHDCGKPKSFSNATGEITFHGHEAVSARLWTVAARRCGMFTPDEVRHVRSIVGFLGHVEQYNSEWSDGAVRRLTVELGELMDDVLAVARADCTTKNPEKRRRAQQRCHELKTRIIQLKEQDAIPPALPTGLGDAIMARLGFDAKTMTREQRQEMGRVWAALKALVEAGDLPRSGEISVYMDRVEGLL